MADRHHSTLLTMLGFAALTINSGLAVYNSRTDAGSVALVTASYGALVQLFRCLRRFEQAAGHDGEGGGGRNTTGARYSALAAVGVATAMCQTALEAHSTRRHDLASAAYLALSYTTLVGLTGLFLRAVARR